MSKRIILISILFLLFQLLAWAQDVPPALFVKEGEQSQALKVTSVSVDTRIYGSLAETTMTLSFYNPASREVAGDLYFPLPQGATISGYALDIGGVMVDGVVVEKDRGRQVFEEIVRQGIDPGLVEWVKGNNFKTRVFPIPAAGSRTVSIRYLCDLIEKEQKRYYYLPLKFKDKVKTFSIHVQVVKTTAAPSIEEGGFANFSFSKWEDSYVAETSLKNADLSRDLVVAIPTVNQPPVLVEKAKDDAVYFVINDSVPPAVSEQNLPSPERITIYWDASSSHGLSDHKRSYKILKDFFTLHKKQRIMVELVVFRNIALKPRQFVITGGDSRKLVEALQQIDYDGGTQMGSLPPAAKNTDYALLFTDGISNFGKENPPPLGTPLYIFSDQAQANHSFLRYLSLQNGGEYFNLNRTPDDIIVQNIGRSAYSFLGVKIEKQQVADVFPSLPEAVSGRFTLAGKLHNKSARVVIQYGYNGVVKKEQSYTISAQDAADSELLRLTWAQKKLAELVIFPERNMEAIIALGKEQGLVTPYTSLIVLESLEQYVEHRIAPPETFPDMREEYFEAIARLDREQAQKKEDKLERMVALWEERVTWWNTEFKYAPDFKYQDTDKQDELTEEAEGGRGGGPEETRPTTADDRENGDELGAAETDIVSGGEAEKSKSEDKEEEAVQKKPEITVQAWDPDTPYLNDLKKAQKKELYQIYLAHKKEYGSSPAFYLDCGDFFYKQGLPELGLRIWSNIAELELENAALLRILAHRLSQEEELALSALLFETVLKLRPEEPQSYRDLALVLGREGEYERAVGLLYQVVLGEWDRFEEIELIALMEMNALIPKAKKAGITQFNVDPRLVKLLDVDVRIIMTWDIDLTDMDLWVTEPSGEKAYYGNRQTTIGANFSRDFTQGYGPEEYIIKKAMKGTYKIEANYFSSSAPAIAGSVTIQVDIFTNYGRPDEERKSITIRLRENKETLFIGEITFK
jgi:Ca-activated chloride channel family protein